MSEILTPEKLATHIFNKWSAELRNKDRSWNAVRVNFEELFYELYNYNVPFETAHGLLKAATAKHMPNMATAKNTWNVSKNKLQNTASTFQEFVEGWKQGIEDLGTEAFYSIYSPPAEKGTETSPEEKTFGNMSSKEYRLQRRYAESFPVLKTDELVKRYEDGVDSYEEFFKGIAENVLEKEDGHE